MAKATRQPPRGPWSRRVIPKGELLRHIAARRSHKEIARIYQVHPSVVTKAVHALGQRELATAVLQSISIRLMKKAERPYVRPEAPLEPVDAAESLLKSVHGLQRIQDVFRAYIEKHQEKLPAKRHRGALFVYLESAKVLAKVVHELVVTQAKLSEWVGAQELRKLILATFDELAESQRPILPAEAKALFLAKFQARIVLLRHGQRPPELQSGPTPEREEAGIQ